MDWVVDLRTVDGAIDDDAFHAAAERLRVASGTECLVAHHPERGCVAALVPVAADDAAEAVRAAGALVLEAVRAVAPTGRATPIISHVAVTRSGTTGGLSGRRVRE